MIVSRTLATSWLYILFIAVILGGTGCSSAPKDSLGHDIALQPNSSVTGCLPPKRVRGMARLVPYVGSVSPMEGTSLGGTEITLSGDGFRSGMQVQLGNSVCSDVKVIDSSSLTCVSSAHPGGLAEVLVKNPDRHCGTLPRAYRFISSVVISPRAKVVAVTNKFKFTADSGRPPYTFQILSGGGKVDASTGDFQAPESPGRTVLRVSDSLNTVSDSVITVNPPLKVVPTTNASDSGGFQFDVLGGAPPVTYRYRDSSQAGSGTGTVVEVIDSMRNMASIAIDVKRSPPLVLYPAFAKAVPGDRITFVATGGKGPYEFSLNGNGKIGETTGIYTAPMESGSDTIQLKDSEGHLASSEVVIQQDAVTVNRIGLGNGHTCVLSNGVVKCSGDNRYGQLGDGTMADRTIPVPVAGLGRDVLTIAAGYTHNCVLAAGGGVKCWGDNRYGQLGNGSNNNSPTAMVVFSLHSGVQAIAAGQYHSCAVVRGGVYCWGSNRRGQLGDGTANPSSVPVAVKGLQDGIIAVVAGAAHTCALSKDGAVKCWGYNFSGQLGQGTTQDQVYPVEVSDLQSGVKAVFAGGYHTCALTDNKDLKCWGSNSMGQLGSDNGKISVYPRLVSGFSGEIKGVATGYYHTCAWNEDSTQCWGYNSDGQLGDNTKSSTGRIKPEKVEGLEDVLGLAAGVNHNCALVPGGMRCWGNNQYGQFGNRSIAGSAIPIPPTALK